MALERERENGVLKRIFSVDKNCFKMIKAKMKPLKPSLKEKKRYLVFEIVSKTKFDFADVVTAVRKEFSRFLGELGMAKAGIAFLPDKWKANRGIIRLNHDMVDHVKASLTMVKDINGVEVIVKSVGVSGILKKAESKWGV
ncbi:hypothetical protein KY328_03230 [Candidatus Woesearchaeota archaeon]|nr:hypothetical protein [Candidatus Woesearchaeota archaeon]MBW3021906.1 hypothetical protein [Candidatus Woesearchaeota archaeon]